MSAGEQRDWLTAPEFGNMVSRTRLTSLFERIRPSVVLLSAPAAYGKTVLAAQLSQSARFNSTAWIRLPGLWSTPEELLRAALGALTGPSRDADSDLICHASASPLPILVRQLESAVGCVAKTPACVVFDGLDACSAPAVSSLATALAERQGDSTYVLAVRSTAPSSCNPVAVWQVGPADLLLDDSEIAGVLRGVLGEGSDVLDVRSVEALASASGRQVGLLSVLARYVVTQPCGWEYLKARLPDVCDLLRHLADSQLRGVERLALECMALLGEGLVEDLSSIAGLGVARDSVAAVSAAIPVAGLYGSGREQAFVLHDLAQLAFADSAQLATKNGQVFDSVLDVLLRRGEYDRVLRLVSQTEDVARIERCLEITGFEALRRGHGRTVDDAMARLPATTLVRKPRLLVLKAAAERELGRLEDAMRSAQAARELAEQEGDMLALANALVMLAQTTTGHGDFLLASAYFDKAVQMCGSGISLETQVALLGGQLVMSVLLGDYGRFEDAGTAMRALRSALPSHADEIRVLADYYLGTSALVCTGCWSEYETTLRRVGRSSSLPYGLRVAAAYNNFACLLETGRTLQATRALEEYLGLVRDAGNAGWNLAGQPLHIWLATMTADAVCSVDELLKACASEWSCGERLSAVTGLLTGTLALLGSQRAEDSLTLAEQALGHAVDLSAASLVWHARLERASAMLSLGDAAASHRVATEIHGVVCSTPAAYLHLKADTILAEIDCRNDDIEAATDRLREHAGYILTESANWQLAMYIRAFPRLLGPLTLSLGAANLPVHLLNMILPKYAEEAVAAARDALPPEELELLSTRLLGKPAAGRRAADRAPKSDVCAVRLFGGLHVDVAGRIVRDGEWHKRKARLLFAMLVSRCGKDIPRDQLTEYLWPEMDASQALNNLYVVWSAMKHALLPGSGRGDKCSYVEHRGGVCRAVHGRVLTDLDEFDEQMAIATKARSTGDAVAERAALRRVSEVYRGELLPGEAYDDWFAALRERCRHDFEDAMLRASALLEAEGDRQGGLALLRRALQHDPWREDLYQAALRLQMGAGQRSAAIETYLTCRSRLVDDLGIDPSAETTRLYEQVLCMEDGLQNR